MRLIACPDCHAQYDVTHLAQKRFPCRCGRELANERLRAMDAQVHRCGACGAQVAADAESCDFCQSEIVRDTSRLSLICPECFARCAEASRFCTACGVGFNPEPIKLDGEELPCPACGNLMPVRAVGGHAVNECGGCHGLWAPGESFGLLVRRATEARRERAELEIGLAPRTTGSNPVRQKVAYRRCPVCESQMHRKNYGRSSGVIIDVCQDHGTWLDADELEQIAGYILSGRSEQKGTVHREHEATSQLETRDRVDGARANAAFHEILARNKVGPYKPPEDSQPSGVLGTVVDLLNALLR